MAIRKEKGQRGPVNRGLLTFHCGTQHSNVCSFLEIHHMSDTRRSTCVQSFTHIAVCPSQALRGMFSSLRDPRVTDEPQRLYVCCHLQPGSDRAGCQSGAVRPTPEHSPSLTKPALPVSVVVSAHLFYFLYVNAPAFILG